MADDSAKGEESELPKDVLAPAEGPRENLVVTAVKFLQNPKVRQSPLSQKKAFLESKGLTKDEIQIAVQRAGVLDDTSSSQTAQSLQPQLQHPAAFANAGLVPAQQFVPPPLPLSPWTRAREIATTTAIVAAVSYAVYSVFKIYIRPWLIGKSETAARLERLEASIMQLQTSVADSSAQMAETLKAIQESLALQRDRGVQGTEVGLRQETHALNEIKSEVASLKGLLLNRRQFPPPPMTSPIIPAWQKSTLHEDQAQFSPLNLKSEGVNNETGNAVNGSEENTVLTADPNLEEEEKQQPLDNSAVPDNQTSEENLQASQPASRDGAVSQSASIDVAVSQSTSSSNNGFEVVKPNSTSDSSAELE